ncbi:MAG: LamG domain-containing protein [Gammaproteobacteria bacterium]
MLLSLTGCGGSGGERTSTNPPSSASPRSNGFVYSGPSAQSPDITRFQTYLWANLINSDRCGACHGDNGQTPRFANSTDVNAAYSAIQAYVSLSDPDSSTLVNKVSQGHNCWLDSDSACAATLTSYIQNWAGTSISAAAQTIDLSAPVQREAGSSKNYPDDASAFSNSVYPLLTTHCAECHSDTADFAQSPYFASADLNTAYAAIKSKIDLNTPEQSRVVVRLAKEFHNCWSTCSSDANTMLNAVTQFSNGVATTEVDPQLVISKALRLTDGIVANSGGRFESNVIALWEFKTGEGNTAYDTSGVEPAMNLTFNGTVSWVGGWGIQISDGKAQASTSSSKKLHDLITATGEYSIEAWVAPANVTQEGPARIISYSGGTTARNFTLGQTLYNYDFLHRSSTTDPDGMPALSTPDADEALQATLQHVVVTFDGINGRRIFVNGQLVSTQDDTPPGTLSEWDDTFAFVIGNEVSNNRLWQGVVRMAAIHDRALTPEQIQQNYDIGVGQKFYLLFNISNLIDLNDSYIVFEVSQFDNYSYLFNAPFFASLDPNAAPNDIPLIGMRIGINGRETTVGQAFSRLNTRLNQADYQNGQQTLSRIGTIIALEKGPDDDEFFLTFEQLGDHSNVYVEADSSVTASANTSTTAVSDVGLRNFAEIRATLSELTGVRSTLPALASTYQTVEQALPATESLDTFVSAQQMAITQLAIEYCNALVEDTDLRSTFFTGFDFSANADTAFDTSGRAQLIDPLIANFVGSNLDTQPTDSAVRTELESLITNLTRCTNTTCDAERTATVAKAACSAVLGSAVMLLQ